MLKSIFSIWFLSLFSIYVVIENCNRSYFHTYSVICLPEISHNTIGEIPIIEAIDDGQVTTLGDPKKFGGLRSACTSQIMIMYEDHKNTFKK